MPLPIFLEDYDIDFNLGQWVAHPFGFCHRWEIELRKPFITTRLRWEIWEDDRLFCLDYSAKTIRESVWGALTKFEKAAAS